MKKAFVSDVKERDQVDSVFLVKEKTTAMAKNGKPYLTLRLMDRTGEIEGRVWDGVDVLATAFEKDDFIKIRAKASVYLGKMQLVISDLACVPDGEVTLSDFLPAGERSVDEMLAELNDLLATVNDPYLHTLLTSFMEDSDFLGCYQTAPAAKGMHHVHLGGLLEHSLAVARLVDNIVPLYEGLNRNLLIAGALLHDIGKVREMTYVRSFDYSDEGKLLGHITIGIAMIHDRIASIDGFPLELDMLLKHMILSHHGQYEYGSPKRPKTVEATILNYLDDLDSKINGIRTHMKKDLPGTSRWTSYHRLYDRYFYRDGYFPVEEIQEQSTEANEVTEVEKDSTRNVAFNNSPFAALQGKNLDLFP